MRHYIGLDVSLKTTSICIMDETGKIICEACAETDPTSIANYINQVKLDIEKIALETGGLSHWLVKELRKLDMPVICIDARKMSAAIAIRTNKTDKNDAREIANALRTGYYKEVHQKQDVHMEVKALLTARRALIEQRTQTINCMRGLLKTQGKRYCGSSQNSFRFATNIRDSIKDLADEFKLAITSLLDVYLSLCKSINEIDMKVKNLTKDDEDIKLLITIPGVGPVTALTFKLEIDEPGRFKKSRSVGAFVGMTPKQYSSGETQILGRISKAGSSELRMLLAESAMCMMYTTKTWSRLKVFGLKIKRKKGHKKATVALGRKLAVVMHRMLVDRKPFVPGNVEQKEIDKILQLTKKEKKALVT
jgi:transposase